MSISVERLENEFEDLTQKINKLCDFTQSEKFDEISKENKKLLNTQLYVMRTYRNILNERLKLIDKEG